MAANRTERLWIGGSAALGLLIVVVGWFFLISPQQSATADVQSQTADAQTRNLTLQTRIANLEAEKRNSLAYAAALAKARQALPNRSNMSLFLRDVQAIASSTSTRVTTLNVGDPKALTPAAAGAAPGAAAAAPGAAAPSTGAAPGTTAPSPTGGLFAISIDASIVGQPAALSNFLTQLQSVQPRAVLVTSVTRSADPGGSAALQLKLSAFVAASTQPASTGGN